jgi:hypothetical protein
LSYHSYPILGKLNGGKSLSTFELLIKVALFVKKEKKVSKEKAADPN